MAKITLEMDDADLERALQAFKEGKLKDLGVRNIGVEQDGQIQWADPDLKKRGTPTDRPGRDAPPNRSRP